MSDRTINRARKKSTGNNLPVQTRTGRDGKARHSQSHSRMSLIDHHHIAMMMVGVGGLFTLSPARISARMANPEESWMLGRVLAHIRAVIAHEPEANIGGVKMVREVRMVPPGWSHPRDGRGKYIPLMGGSYGEAAREWDEGWAAWQRDETENYSAQDGEPKWEPKPPAAWNCTSYTDWHGGRPSPDDYMPEFAPGTATMLVMYENVTEGTPISPAFATPQELARWLAGNNANTFAGRTATYEQWLAACRAPASKRSNDPSATLERHRNALRHRKNKPQQLGQNMRICRGFAALCV